MSLYIIYTTSFYNYRNLEVRSYSLAVPLPSASDPPIHFGRKPRNECGAPVQCGQCTETFEAAVIEALDDATFNVVIGPSGADRGYEAITG